LQYQYIFLRTMATSCLRTMATSGIISVYFFFPETNGDVYSLFLGVTATPKCTHSLAPIEGRRDDHYEQQQHKSQFPTRTHSLSPIGGKRDALY
jgi:hypothetical protein